MVAHGRGVECFKDYCARCGRLIPPKQVKVWNAKEWHPECLEIVRCDLYETRMEPIRKRDQEYQDALVKQYGLWRNR